MRHIDTDILVIGTGGAGLRAALSARETAPDLRVMAVSRGDPGKHGLTATACSDRMAFHVSFPFTPPGGEGAWRAHAYDIHVGGGHVSDPNLAELLARESAAAYDRLADLGVPFVRGSMSRPVQFVTDGSSVARACYTGPYTARDIQAKAMTTPEFELGHAKGMDGFKPMGPALVTADEFDTPLDVHLEARVNGEIRQDARTSDFVHPLPRCIAHITRFMRLDPGDVILTGSPAGVGFFRGLFLKPGDVVELSADKIGTLRNPVVETR